MESGSPALLLPFQRIVRPSLLQGCPALKRLSSVGLLKQLCRSVLPDYLRSRSVHVEVLSWMGHYRRLPYSWLCHLDGQTRSGTTYHYLGVVACTSVGVYDSSRECY